MTQFDELKRLAEACGDLNWRFLTEKLTEYGIRDDHGYIAFLPVGHPAKYGACPDREVKARFLGALTPSVVLALIAEIEKLQSQAESRRSLHGRECVAAHEVQGDLIDERDRAKDELETFKRDAGRFQFIAQDAESSLERIYGDNWLGVVDQLIGMGDKP